MLGSNEELTLPPEFIARASHIQEFIKRFPSFDGKESLFMLTMEMKSLKAISKFRIYKRLEFKKRAINNQELEIQLFTKNASDYILQGWRSKDLVDWLLSSHIHFVICHPH